MFFDVKHFSLKRKGRFAKCWLAATCPKQFRKFVNRAEVDNIQVTILCDNILERVFNQSGKNNGRLPLHMAAQLTYGTVCIHRQQVDSLYEHTSKMLSARTCILFESIKRKALATADQTVPVKRPRVASVSCVVSRLISDFHESIIKDVEMLDQTDVNSMPFDAVTLREAISEHIGQDCTDGFDVLTEAERMDFMYGDLTPRERKRCIEQESGMLIVVAEAHEPPQEEILCSQNSVDAADGCASLPVYSYRSAARARDEESSTNYENQAMELDCPTENITQNASLETQMYDRNGPSNIQASPCVFAPCVKSIPKKRWTKPKAKKGIPTIDAVTQISASEMTDPDRYDASKRCWGPLDEIPDFTDLYNSLRRRSKRDPITHQLWIGTKSFSQIVRIGKRTQMSSVLCSQFARHELRCIVEPIDEEWVMSLCGELPKIQTQHKSRPTRKSNRSFLTTPDDEYGQITPENVAGNISTKKNGQVNTFKRYESNISVEKLNTMSYLGLEPDVPYFLNIEHQLELLLQSLNINEVHQPNDAEYDLQTDSCDLRYYRELHQIWGKKGMLEKLIHLWRLSIEPIDMKMLMRSANDVWTNRRCAALAFYTLLDLNKIGLVELHKDDMNRIRHVGKTFKLEQMLDSLNV